MTEPKNKLSRADKTSLLALILSIAALALGVIETQIMSKQQDTMVQQQKAAVWPYVELKGGIELNDSLVFKTVAENKGVGPAIVKEISIDLGGKSYQDFRAFSQALDSILGKDQYSIHHFGISQRRKSVYKSGESKTLFEITLHDRKRFFEKVAYFNIHLTYCSILDECWGANGSELEE